MMVFNAETQRGRGAEGETPGRKVSPVAPAELRLGLEGGPFRAPLPLRLFAVWLGLLLAVTARAASVRDRPLLPPAPGSGIHAPWDRLVRSFVHDGVVDYGCMQAHEAQLDRYLALLAALDPARLSREAQLAVWINAYNAFTVKLILHRYPGIRSIKEIPRRWKVRDWTVGGSRYSLDQIENEVLRARFHEPRIHFAINCASRSCPDLASEAYLAARLDAQLDEAARRFLRHPNKGARLVRERGLFGTSDRLYLSAIFKWFRPDFERGHTLMGFITPYLAPATRARLAALGGRVEIAYRKYDWSLNGR